MDKLLPPKDKMSNNFQPAKTPSTNKLEQSSIKDHQLEPEVKRPPKVLHGKKDQISRNQPRRIPIESIKDGGIAACRTKYTLHIKSKTKTKYYIYHIGIQ